MSIPQHPGPPPIPPARPPRRRWILVGAVTVFVALAGVTATLYATGVFGSPGKSNAKIEESDRDEPTSVTELSSPSPDDQPAKYRYRDQACEQVDWKPMDKLTGLDAEDIETTYETYPDNVLVKCDTPNSEDRSHSTVEIHLKDSASGAEEEYESLTDGVDGEDAAGPWSQGTWAAANVTDGSAAIYLHAQDSNMYLTFSAGADGNDDLKKLKKEVVALAEGLLTILKLEEQ